MPKFRKSNIRCADHFDEWIYNLKNMERMGNVEFKDKEVFKRLWDLSNCSTLSIEERHRYERSLKAYRDYINQVDYAMAEGEAKGEAKERMKNAKRMKEEGIDINLIHKITDLSIEEIENL